MSLLSHVQLLIERTYDMEPALVEAGRFVIGDRGLAELHAGRHAEGRDLSRPEGAMLLVRGDVPAIRACIYYPDRIIANLERHDPRRGVSERNLQDFATFIEELDHLLVVASALRDSRPVRAIELELHANVTKILVTSLFLARTQGVARLQPAQRARLRWHLLGRGDYGSERPGLRERYRTARRHAVGFLRRLEATPPGGRPRLLRRFSRAPYRAKVELSR